MCKVVIFRVVSIVERARSTSSTQVCCVCELAVTSILEESKRDSIIEMTFYKLVLYVYIYIYIYFLTKMQNAPSKFGAVLILALEV